MEENQRHQLSSGGTSTSIGLITTGWDTCSPSVGELETPCYIFSRRDLTENYRVLARALGDVPVYYAMKANGELGVAACLAAAGCGFEVASLAEHDVLTQCGVSAERVICSNPVLSTYDMVELARRGNTYFVFDSEAQFDKIVSACKAPFLVLRLTTASWVRRDHGFGLSPEAADFCRTRVRGLTFYARDNTDTETIDNILKDVTSAAERFPNLELVNLGGNYRLPRYVRDDFYSTVRRHVDGFRRMGLKVIAEPGYNVASTAGALVTTVELVLDKKSYLDVFIDGGRETGIRFQPESVRPLTNAERSGLPTNVRFYGLTCDRALLFQTELQFRPVVGEKLVLTKMGAYSVVFANRFHGRPLPRVYWTN